MKVQQEQEDKEEEFHLSKVKKVKNIYPGEKFKLNQKIKIIF